MYRITREIAYHLLDNSKGFNLPSVDEKSDRPFAIRNVNAIGSISPILVTGSDCKYLVELDPGEFGVKHLDVSGYYLYRRNELKTPDEAFEVPRSAIDRYCTNSEELLDITDCVIELPSAIDKLTSINVVSLDRLLELEPGLINCIEEKDNAHGNDQLF